MPQTLGVFEARDPAPPIPTDAITSAPARIISEWNTQRLKYDRLWYWYDGSKWLENAAIKGSGQQTSVKLFPLGLNPVRKACRTHRAALFGEVPDTSDPLVRCVIDDPRVNRARAKTLQNDLINAVWYYNSGRALQHDNGLITQILGGCVFRVAWEPWSQFLQIPIRIDTIAPEQFLPIYSPSDPWHLHECWLVREMDVRVAELAYGYKPSDNQARVYYVEHWTRTEYEVTIGDQPITVSWSGEQIKLGGENPFGIVPFVYIPHVREGGFYGQPVIHQMDGALLEYNARMADIGDSVRDGAHPDYMAANIAKSPSGVRLNTRVEATNLGNAPPGGGDPTVWPLDAPGMPKETFPFVERLARILYDDMDIPPVALGEDEGSQRSSLTLTVRFWPLTSHVRGERTDWTMGLNVIGEYILRMAATKREHPALSEIAVTEDEFNLRMRQEWAPILPRDAEAEQNLLILRKTAGVLSTYSSVRMSGDIEDIEEEVKRIEEDKQKDADLAAQSGAAAANNQQAPVDLNEPVAQVPEG